MIEVKIVLVINDLKGNGAERVVITLAREFKQQGHQVLIVCFNDTVEFDISGLATAIFPIKYWRWIPRTIRGSVISVFLDRFIIKKIGALPDLVLSNLLPCDRIMSRSKLPNVHLVLHSTLSLERGNFTKFPELKIYDKKPVICVSNGVKEDYEEIFGKANCITATQIYNPIDYEFINKSANTSVSDLPKNKFIIHVGKFNKWKRHDLLIKAFAQAKTSHDLVLLGQGALVESTKQLARQLGVSHRVHFLGFKSNPYPYIKSADLLVLSSDFEGLSMVLLEAVALSTPAISTNCKSGPSEILPDSCLYPVNDIEALSTLLSVPDYSIYRATLKPKFTIEYAAREYLQLAP